MPKTRNHQTGAAPKARSTVKANRASLGFEEKLWQAADRLYRDPRQRLGLRADSNPANPPFNVNDSGGDRLRDDVQ